MSLFFINSLYIINRFNDNNSNKAITAFDEKQVSIYSYDDQENDSNDFVLGYEPENDIYYFYTLENNMYVLNEVSTEDSKIFYTDENGPYAIIKMDGDPFLEGEKSVDFYFSKDTIVRQQLVR